MKSSTKARTSHRKNQGKSHGKTQRESSLKASPLKPQLGAMPSVFDELSSQIAQFRLLLAAHEREVNRVRKQIDQRRERVQDRLLRRREDALVAAVLGYAQTSLCNLQQAFERDVKLRTLAVELALLMREGDKLRAELGEYEAVRETMQNEFAMHTH